MCCSTSNFGPEAAIAVSLTPLRGFPGVQAFARNGSSLGNAARVNLAWIATIT
jgi:hypothetical protein